MTATEYGVRNEKNYEIFRECVAGVIINKSTKTLPTKPKRKVPKSGRAKIIVQSEFRPSDDSEELAEFIDVRPPWL